MVGKVEQRREARKATIIATAWELAREHGVGGVTLHGLARALGIRQPSLYEYFESKHALFDAMFADGNRRILERFDQLVLPEDPRAAVKLVMREFVRFNVEDTERSMLLFHRPVPGFEPSDESYALAREVLDRVVALLHAAGMTDQGDVDCFVAMVAGLIDAQISNDPGGTRWVRHLDRLVDLHLDDARRRNQL